MSSGSPMPPHRVPTLTEVVAWPEAMPLPEPMHRDERPRVDADMALTPPASSLATAAEPGMSKATAELIVQRVLDDVQRQIDLMLEYRLRETLKPLLDRAADGIVRDTRHELASTLRDVVARAVAQELLRYRAR